MLIHWEFKIVVKIPEKVITGTTERQAITVVNREPVIPRSTHKHRTIVKCPEMIVCGSTNQRQSGRGQRLVYVTGIGIIYKNMRS